MIYKVVLLRSTVGYRQCSVASIIPRHHHKTLRGGDQDLRGRRKNMMENNEEVMKGKARRLILWCLPRTGSTALAKCLSFLDEDTEMWFEPFNLCRIISIRVKKETGRDLPKEFKENEMMYEAVAAGLKDKLKVPSATIINPSLLSYAGVQKSLEESKRRTVIVKEMAVASYDSYDYFPKGYRHILVIRDPTRVISSFKKMEIDQRGEEFANADLEKVLPTYPTYHWFGEMHALWKHMTKVGGNPLIIDTEDFLANPAPFLKKICEVMEVEYRDGLLKWEASKDVIKTWRSGCIDMYTSDNLAQSQVFKKAFESSGFVETNPKPLPQNLTQDCIRIIGKCVDFYQEMYPHRFVPE